MKIDLPKTTFAEEIRMWRYNQLITTRIESLAKESINAKNLLRAATDVA